MLNRHNFDIAELAPDDESRVTLCGILVGPDGTAETDGRQAVIVSSVEREQGDLFADAEGVEPAEYFTPFILDRDSSLKVARSIPKKSDNGEAQFAVIDATTECSDRAMVSVNDIWQQQILRARKISGKFPDVHKVFPDPDRAKFVLTMSPALLIAVLKAAQKFCAGHDKGAIELRLFGPGKPMESPLNPRKRFDQHNLEDLADSIRTHGILTPLLVRPIQDVGYEIVAGHRRYRAAAIAGVSDLPCIIRPMADEQFLEILTIENLQREDVHPLEEAEGYAALLKMPGYDAPAIAPKIGKTESYVYGRLRLLDLKGAARQSFLDNRITAGHARWLARLPEDKQEEILSECFDFDGELLPVSEIANAVKGELGGKDLRRAPFDLEDADLVAAAGACSACPKCTGANRQLFDTRGDNTCFDASCYDSKMEAHMAKHALLVQVSETYSKPAPGLLSSGQYTDARVIPDVPDEPEVDDPEVDSGDIADGADDEPLAECPYAEDAIVAEGYHKGQIKRICRNPQCPEHGRDIHVADRSSTSSTAATPDDWKRQQEEEKKRRAAEEMKHAAARQARVRALENILGLDWSDAMSSDVANYFLATSLDRFWNVDNLRALAKRHEIATDKKAAPEKIKADILKFAPHVNDSARGKLVIHVLLLDHIEPPNQYTKREDLLARICRENGINIEKFERDCLAELKAKTKDAQKVAKKKGGKK